MPTLPSDVLTGNQLLEMYYFARLARDLEERLVILFRQSQVIGGELAAIIAEEAFEHLDAPIMRIASIDAPAPYAPPLEAAFLPSVEKVVAGAKKLVEY